MVPPRDCPDTGRRPVFPWVAERVVRARGAVIISRLDELPPDVSRDRQSFQEFSIKTEARFRIMRGES